MRILIALLLISTQAFGQDQELFDYVNTYRVANGVSELVFDADLYEISKANTTNMVANDSTMHSRTDTYECAVRAFTLTPTLTKVLNFDIFLKKYFNMKYIIPADSMTIADVRKFTLLYTVYAWHKSSEHRAVMLCADATIGSASITIGDIKFKSNKKVIGGKVIKFNKIISHFEVEHVATLNLNL